MNVLYSSNTSNIFSCVYVSFFFFFLYKLKYIQIQIRIHMYLFLIFRVQSRSQFFVFSPDSIKQYVCIDQCDFFFLLFQSVQTRFKKMSRTTALSESYVNFKSVVFGFGFTQLKNGCKISLRIQWVSARNAIVSPFMYWNDLN